MKLFSRLLLILLFALLLPFCGETAQTDGGSSHFLGPCEVDADCQDGLSCLCNVCTTLCRADETCSTHDEAATCMVSSCAGTATCGVACDSARECAGLAEANYCTDGLCSYEERFSTSGNGGESPEEPPPLGDETGGSNPGGDSGEGPVPGSCAHDRIWHPGGAVDHVSDPDAPPIEEYCLDAYEVTVSDYAACVEDAGCQPPIATSNYFEEDSDNQPVNHVDLSASQAYCAWAGGRLPQIRELVWAAQGEENEWKWVWGNEAPLSADDPKKLCWEETSVCDVGSYPLDQTARGVFDLSGNVQEWSLIGSENQCLFGGSYDVREDHFPGLIQTATCRPYEASFFYVSVGFRCAANTE